jgi:hypothetical protein
VIRRKPRTDRVSPEDAEAVFLRDRGCVLVKLHADHECRDHIDACWPTA